MAEIRLYMLATGTLRCKLHNIKMNQGLGEPYEIPVPWFLITHPRGNVVIDGGNAVECATDPVGHWGDITSVYWPVMTEQDGCLNQSRRLGIAPDSVRYVLQSHLHLDHTGAVGRFPAASHVVQRSEYEYAFNPDWFAAGGYILGGGALLAHAPQPTADSAEQRQQAAIKAFEKAGGHFEEHYDPAEGKRVGFVDLSGRRGGTAALKTLADAKNVAWLFLQDSETTDATLKDIGKFTHLSHLFLHNTQVNGSGLNELGNLQNLVSIDLSGAPVTDAGAKNLATLKGVTAIDLSDTLISDAGLERLAHLNKPWSIHLHNTKVSDAGLKDLATLITITDLDLSDTNVTDAGMKQLARLKNLWSLRLEHTKVTDAGLQELAGLRNLSKLSLHGTKVTAAGRRELQKVLPTCVVTIDPSEERKEAEIKRQQAAVAALEAEAGPTALKAVESLPKLFSNGVGNPAADKPEVPKAISQWSVTLDSTDENQETAIAVLEKAGATVRKTADPKSGNIVVSLSFKNQPTDAMLRGLALFKNLSSIDLSHTKITDDNLMQLPNFKNLSAINLSDTGVTNVGLKQLTVFRSLKDLRLGRTKVTNAGMQELANFKNLSVLWLSGTCVRDSGLKDLTSLTDLTALALDNTNVTDHALKELVGMKNLSKLYLNGTRVTDAGVAELKQALPECTIIR